ncbi:hypothetical protein BDZ91DRAFT_709710 [Kalaharituber pfeilii]|nr:hypothetical protein BDZ91DRAFT_709710 [Kalaharituber pfeilii]
MEEVPDIPQPIPARVPTDYLTIVNLYTQRNSQKPCDGVPITRSALRAQFPTFNGLPEVEPPYNSISTLEESVHCECSVAMHIRSLLVDKNFTNTPHIKIGVSKQSCLLCHEFLLALNFNDSEHYTRPVYLTSGWDRKVPSTWRAPSGAPQACIRRVEECVQVGLDSIIHLARNRRGSDSAKLRTPKYIAMKECLTDESGDNAVFDDTD